MIMEIEPKPYKIFIQNKKQFSYDKSREDIFLYLNDSFQLFLVGEYEDHKIGVEKSGWFAAHFWCLH